MNVTFAIQMYERGGNDSTPIMIGDLNYVVERFYNELIIVTSTKKWKSGHDGCIRAGLEIIPMMDGHEVFHETYAGEKISMRCGIDEIRWADFRIESRLAELTQAIRDEHNHKKLNEIARTAAQ